MHDVLGQAINHTLEVEKMSNNIYNTISGAEDRISSAASSTFHMLSRPFKIILFIFLSVFVVACILGLGFVGNVLNKMKEGFPKKQRHNSRAQLLETTELLNNREEEL